MLALAGHVLGAAVQNLFDAVPKVAVGQARLVQKR